MVVVELTSFLLTLCCLMIHFTHFTLGHSFTHFTLTSLSLHSSFTHFTLSSLTLLTSLFVSSLTSLTSFSLLSHSLNYLYIYTYTSIPPVAKRQMAKMSMDENVTPEEKTQDLFPQPKALCARCDVNVRMSKTSCRRILSLSTRRKEMNDDTSRLPSDIYKNEDMSYIYIIYF